MYVGRFLRRAEMVTDANGNRNIVHIEPKMVKSELLDNEAILKYTKAKKNRSFKFRKIEEKEMLAYPSAPPRN